jgi:hypothetical protein
MHTAPERVTITLPAEIKDLFAWLKNYDPRFEGRDASIAAFLLKKGVEAHYAEDMQNAEPLDAEVEAALATHSLNGLREALEDEEPHAPQAKKVASGRR